MKVLTAVGVTFFVVFATSTVAEPAPKIFASAEETEPLKVGDDIAHANVKTLDGTAVDLRELATREATVIIFYRGGWYPICNAHLQDLKDAMAGLKELGYQVLAVSADVPEKMLEAKEKQELPYLLLSARI